MNYILISNPLSLSPIEKKVVIKLLIQCLVEYKFLLTLDNLLFQGQDLVFSKLRTHIDDPIKFETLFNLFPLPTSTLELDHQMPECYRYRDDSCDGRTSTSSGISTVSTYFSEYKGTTKILFSNSDIDQLIKNLDPTLIDYSRIYWKMLIETTCSLSIIFSKLNNLDSQFDSKNYSIFCLQSALDRKLSESYPRSEFYLIYQMDGNIYAGHIILIVTNNRPINTNYIELISIQTSTLLVVNYSCRSSKAGIAKQIFKYIIDDFYPNIIKANYRAEKSLIYAYAWKIVSDLLHNQFGFDYIRYNSLSSIDEIDYYDDYYSYEPDRYLRLYTGEKFYDFHKTVYDSKNWYENMVFFDSLSKSLELDINLDLLQKIKILNQAIKNNVGHGYNDSLYIFTFKIMQ